MLAGLDSFGKLGFWVWFHLYDANLSPKWSAIRTQDGTRLQFTAEISD